MAVPSLRPALVGGTAALLVSLDAAPSEANGEQRTNAGNGRECALRFTALRSNGDDRSDALSRLG
ncbi:hypothetical protein [Candidatus Chloroploca asiatica]|uniref:Uncharacterized protein n=1 Tax=Candidatus Chloroploca asiatica TaxID=1506545 RepID=A0A2H3KHV8_9CHLR|nr:hypothetical protein [Candidatus Chloroploca asiatica]PDV97384.1 hypothetical protein A9Q02_18695 [Candidatus Chloroploca asiatica]